MRAMGLTGPRPISYFFFPYGPIRELDFLRPTDDPGRTRLPMGNRTIYPEKRKILPF